MVARRTWVTRGAEATGCAGPDGAAEQMSGVLLTRVLSIGDRVFDGDYRVLSRFRRVVNMRDGDRLVSLVSPAVEAGPVNIVLSDFDAGSVRFLNVRRGSISLNGRALSTESTTLYSSTFDVRGAGAASLRPASSLLSALLAERAPLESLAHLVDTNRVSRMRPGFQRELALHARACVRDMFFGDMLRGVSRLRGSGAGLTPSGDDLIVGVVVALHVLEQVSGRSHRRARELVGRAADGGGMLCRTFLRLALDGCVSESMRALVLSLVGGSSMELATALGDVMEVGATSGADMAVGLCLGVKHGLSGWPRWGRGGLPAAMDASALRERGEEAVWS